MKHTSILWLIGLLMAACSQPAEENTVAETPTSIETPASKVEAPAPKESPKATPKKIVPEGPIDTWAKFKSLAHFDQPLKEITEDLIQDDYTLMDSATWAYWIKGTYYNYEEAYLLAVQPNIGSYYPCIIYHKVADTDQLMDIISLIMIDSMAMKRSYVEYLVASGCDPLDCWSDSSSVVSDGKFVRYRNWEKDCYDFEDQYMLGAVHRLETAETFLIAEHGKIFFTKKIDTLNITLCDNP